MSEIQVSQALQAPGRVLPAFCSSWGCGVPGLLARPSCLCKVTFPPILIQGGVPASRHRAPKTVLTS